MLTPAFLRKLEKLDKDGLETLRRELVGRKEAARMRFSRSRSIRDGDSYGRRSAELGEVRTRLSLLR